MLENLKLYLYDIEKVNNYLNLGINIYYLPLKKDTDVVNVDNLVSVYDIENNYLFSYCTFTRTHSKITYFSKPTNRDIFNKFILEFIEHHNQLYLNIDLNNEFYLDLIDYDELKRPKLKLAYSLQRQIGLDSDEQDYIGQNFDIILDYEAKENYIRLIDYQSFIKLPFYKRVNCIITGYFKPISLDKSFYIEHYRNCYVVEDFRCLDLDFIYNMNKDYVDINNPTTCSSISEIIKLQLSMKV